MALWTPADITTALWLDAADSSTITDVSDKATEWADKSGNLITATSATGPNILSADLNGLNTLQWTGSAAQRMALGVNVDIYEHTAIIVARHDNESLGQLFSHTSLNRQLRLETSGGELTIVGVSPTPYGNTLKTTGQETGQYYLFGLEGDPADGRFFVDGSLSASGGTLASAFVFNQIGARLSGSEPLTGRIAEVVWLPAFSGTTNRQLVEGYLAHKWGLAAGLPGDHPYKNEPPIILPSVAFSGTVRDKDGNLAARVVLVIREADQTISGVVVSDEITGAYELVVDHDEPHTLIFSGEPDRNAIVYSGVMPE